MHQSKTGGLHKHAILGPVYMDVVVVALAIREFEHRRSKLTT